MTNTSNMSSGWEVAGTKKAKNPVQPNKQVGAGPAAKAKAKEAVAKFPKQETLQPIKLDGSVFDALRESDDDLDEMNNNKAKKPQQASAKTSTKMSSNDTSDSSSSPKPTTHAKKLPQLESLNLLQSSIAANQKKKPTASSPSAVKSDESELEKQLKKLNSDDLKKELDQLNRTFPNDFPILSLHLAEYVNNQLLNIPDYDPSVSHENESSCLISNLDKNTLKTIESNISKMNSAQTEKFFENLFQNLFIDGNKVPSVHGYKLFIQILIKLKPNLNFTNLEKLSTILTNNSHRHKRCLIAFWALAQVGYSNVWNGIKIWFNCMLPFIATKGSTLFIATYLNSLFNYHKIDKTTTCSSLPDTTAQNSISFDNYNQIFELVNDKTIPLPKDTQAKLKSSFDIVRSLFLQQKMAHNNADHFKLFMSQLPPDATSKQSDILDILSKMLMKDKDLILEWKDFYFKQLAQSVVLLEYLKNNHLKALKSNKNAGETIRYLDQHSNSLIHRLKTGKEAGLNAKQQYFARVKQANKQTGGANELGLLIKFNNLTKQLIKNHFKRTSFFSMVTRPILTILLLVAFAYLFVYWDVNANNSTFTNVIQKKLKEYELLEPTLNLISWVQNALNVVKKQVDYYIPLWYSKTTQFAGPVLANGWNVTKEYSQFAWTKMAPIRDTISDYANKSLDNFLTNFPALAKNLVSVYELFINYLTTLVNFVAHYVSQLIDFVGIQLLGWKKGDFEQFFIDAFKVLIDRLAKLLKQLNDYLNQKKSQ